MTAPAAEAFAFATVAELAAALRAGTVTSGALVELALRRIARLDAGLNAFIHVAGDDARRAAAGRDRELAAGRDRGPLHGLPVAIKDIIDVAGMPTSHGSGGSAELPRRDAILVARLREAGAVVIGKTNTYEFAYAAYHRRHGYTRNPRDAARTAGATSGGSAAAVAAGLAVVATGTDAGGSVRIPSAFCGICGMKATHGAIDLTGAFPSSWTLDHGGAMGRSAGCVRATVEAMAGRAMAADDGHAADRPAPPARRFGVVAELAGHEAITGDVTAAFRGALGRLEDAGAAVVEIALPEVLEGNDLMMAILYPEVFVIHEQRMATRRADYDPGTVAEIEPGRALPAATYLKALAGRDALRAAVARVLDDGRLDALLCPTAPWVAPRRLHAPNDPAMMLEGVCAAPFSVAGVPASSLPCGPAADGMPAGLQIVGRAGEDGHVMALGDDGARQGMSATARDGGDGLRRRFQRDGFVFPVRVLPRAAARRARGLFLEARRAARRDPAMAAVLDYKANLALRWVDDIVRVPALLDAVAALLGPDLLLWSCSFVDKAPRSAGRYTWHQDATYWGLTPPLGVTVWLALGDVGPENGGLSFVPGVHRGGQLPHSDTFAADVLLPRGQRIDALPDADKAVAAPPVEAEAALVLAPGELRASGREIEAEGVRALALPLNVCRDDSVARFHDAAVAAFGKVDILINAAGGSAHHGMIGHPDALWSRTIDVNLNGPYRTIRRVFAGMCERGWGRIVNIATTGARVGAAGHAAMCASKTGLLGLTRCVALEGAPHGVTCNAIDPGSVSTPHVERVALPNKLRHPGIADSLEDHMAAIPATVPRKRWIEAEEIGAFAAFLCHEEARGITSEDMQISGGAHW